MQSWIDSLYHGYPVTEESKILIENYKELVNEFDNRIEEYPQPEF